LSGLGKEKNGEKKKIRRWRTPKKRKMHTAEQRASSNLRLLVLEKKEQLSRGGGGGNGEGQRKMTAITQEETDWTARGKQTGKERVGTSTRSWKEFGTREKRGEKKSIRTGATKPRIENSRSEPSGLEYLSNSIHSRWFKKREKKVQINGNRGRTKAPGGLKERKKRNHLWGTRQA